MTFTRRTIGIAAFVVLAIAVTTLTSGCGGGEKESGISSAVAPTAVPSFAASLTSTPPPASAPKILIRLSRADDPKYTEPIRLEVVTGEYQIVGGATLWAGSDVSVQEEWLAFPSGLAIDVGSGGVTLGGQFYPEGTRLRVQAGALVEVDEE